MRKVFIGIVAGLLYFSACSGSTGRNNIQSAHVTDSIQTIHSPAQQKLPDSVIIEKDFLYDKYTLQDTYPYKDTTRRFQWDKIKEKLALVDSIQQSPAVWGIAQNRQNIHGKPELAEDYRTDKRNHIVDEYGMEQNQAIPLYINAFDDEPERYELDGSLVKILGGTKDTLHVETFNFPGTWYTPEKYIKTVDTTDSVILRKVIIVDRTNQNIATFEKSGNKWLVRSMNPATTGLEHPPYQKATPLGIFVFQEKKQQMQYMVDGSDAIGGFAPYASRFSNGGYIHGVPVNAPRTQLIEYSETLGTTPRSHMCVRNATSHAKFIYDWGPIGKTLVIVIE